MRWLGMAAREQVPFRRIFTPLERPVPTDANIVTAYTDGQVTLRSNRSKIGYHEAKDLSGFQGVEPGDFVVHGLDILRGSVGVSDSRGALSAVCTVCRPIQQRADPRFMAYVIQIQAESGLIRAMARGVREGGADFRRWGTLAELPLPLVHRDEQRRIADFLDDRVARIDRVIAGRHKQAALLAEARSRLSYDMVRGATIPGERHNSRLDWLGTIPTAWGVLSVGSQFTAELGKMLDDKRQTGAHRLPYLRNTNVQWDEVLVDDLKEMDIPEAEYSRYTVEIGDLLICEGGQPGRSAVWEGGIEPLGFQKALHRARSRGHSLADWLLECLRVAVDLDVFAATSGQTTIAHLTNEQLRAQRFPFPKRDVQSQLLADLRDQSRDMARAIKKLNKSINLLTAYKSSLITAAVTGELDVSTAGSSIPG